MQGIKTKTIEYSDSNKRYIKPSEIHIELDKRMNDHEFMHKLDSFWANEKPTFIDPKKKYGVFSRSIFTPNYELRYFIDLCKTLELEPILLEYTDTKFVTKNLEKYRLAKLVFYEGIGKKNGIKSSQISIVNFNTEEGKKMNEVETLLGNSLVDFHHRLLLEELPDISESIFDFSDWFNRTRNKSELYYFYYLTIFLKNCVLFENYISDDEEENKFTKKHFVPSFDGVANYFGIKPLVTPLLPLDSEKSDWWYAYNTGLKEKISGSIVLTSKNNDL